MSIDRRTFEAAALMVQHPPRWRDRNKLVVADLSCPLGAEHRGTIGYSRWRAIPLPVHVEPLPADLVATKPGFYDYRAALEGAIEWHVNFADPHLFVAYGGSLLAQDELQVAEHPALGALREALVAAGDAALTVDDGEPTPVLVTGVERRVSIATEPDAAAGRPWGLYGNAFARADPDVVRGATTRLDPPTVSNLIAMAALPGGFGAYRGLRDRLDPGHRVHGLPGGRHGVRTAGSRGAGRRAQRLLGLRRVRWEPGPDVGAADGRGGHGRAGSTGAPHRWP